MNKLVNLYSPLQYKFNNPIVFHSDFTGEACKPRFLSYNLCDDNTFLPVHRLWQPFKGNGDD